MPKSPAILLVEDDVVLSELYQSGLVRAGYRVISATNGTEGLRLALENGIDLVLLDILLPKLDGYELLKKLREDKKTKNLPVIIFSNLSQKEEIERGYKSGADDYIIKTSVTPKELVLRVDALLKKHEAKSQ